MLSIMVVEESAQVDVRSLHRWLSGEPELRGRVSMDLAEPTSGTLGGASDVLVVALGSGGIGTVLASALVSWLRRRTGNLTIKVTRSDSSSLEVTAEHVKGLDPDGVRDLVEKSVRFLLAEAEESHIAESPSANE